MQRSVFQKRTMVEKEWNWNQPLEQSSPPTEIHPKKPPRQAKGLLVRNIHPYTGRPFSLGQDAQKQPSGEHTSRTFPSTQLFVGCWKYRTMFHEDLPGEVKKSFRVKFPPGLQFAGLHSPPFCRLPKTPPPPFEAQRERGHVGLPETRVRGHRGGHHLRAEPREEPRNAKRLGFLSGRRGKALEGSSMPFWSSWT